jgi:type II secretory pathway component GspD/PulD (secretin)
MRIRPPRAGLVPAILLVTLMAWPVYGEPPAGRLVQATFYVADLLRGTRPVPPDLLLEMITDTVRPTSWSGHGGSGTIDYHPATGAVLINQAEEVLRDIDTLLTNLRRLPDDEVAFEVRLVSLATDFMDHIGKPETLGCLRKAMSGKPAIITDDQLRVLMEAAQGDVRTNVMQAPKMTATSRQPIHFQVLDQENFVVGFSMVMKDGAPVATPQTETHPSGVEMTLWPALSADRHDVRVYLRMALHCVETGAPVPVTVSARAPQGKSPGAWTQTLQQPRPQTMTLAKSVAMPAGRTAVLYAGTHTTTGRSVCSPAFLSDVPFLCDLFCGEAYTHEHEAVLVLVTPRVIVSDKEEPRHTGAASPTKPTVSNLTAGVIQCVAEEPAGQSATTPDAARVAKLVARYRRACAAGRMDEARELAAQALAIDPGCFSKPKKPRP